MFTNNINKNMENSELHYNKEYSSCSISEGENTPDELFPSSKNNIETTPQQTMFSDNCATNVPGDSDIEHQMNAERTEAFNLLADKYKMAEKLVRTQMCNSVIEKKQCPHGEKCRYAHSTEELVISECFFKERCRFVRKNQCGRYYNQGKVKKCSRRHPGETRENLIARIGKIESHTNNSSALFPTVVKESPNVIPLDAMTLEVHRNKKNIPMLDPETVIRVPESIAKMAMELAIANGNTNIRIEII